MTDNRQRLAVVSGGRGFDGTPIKSGAAGAPAFARDARFGWAGLLATRAPARRPSVPIHETPPRIDDDGIAVVDFHSRPRLSRFEAARPDRSRVHRDPGGRQIDDLVAPHNRFNGLVRLETKTAVTDFY